MKITIIGTGWLGLPLLTALVRDGHEVIGTSRSEERLERIRQAGGTGVELSLPGDLSPLLLEGPEVVIVTLPPGGRRLGERAPAVYLERLQALSPLLEAAPFPLVIYTSSTGVYGAAAGAVDETTAEEPSTHSSRAVVAAEAWLSAHAASLVVLRLAGLIASDRHPGRFYGGRKRVIPKADAPVNLVHRTDVISAVQLILSRPKEFLGQQLCFNVCAVAHPAKGDYYAAAATALGLTIAGKESGGQEGKVIRSEKLRRLGWQPEHDNLEL